MSIHERLLSALGVRKVRKGHTVRYLRFPDDFSAEHVDIHRRIEPYTMTRPERTYALIEAVKYVCANDLHGAFVECGVWRGGSVMAMAMQLMALGQVRDIYLFDTFAGMSAPTQHDKTSKGKSAMDTFRRLQTSPDTSKWDFASLDEVKRNVLGTGYPEDRFHFIRGKVEDTLPSNAPDAIALLRLDTDFYQSTMHELIHLYPRLTSRGVLLLDDYGHWQGARRAVDEYFRDNPPKPLLTRIDFSARLAIAH